jgi:UPF0755 protein
MYIRKILVGILIAGIIVGCFMMYNISQTIFKPITAFNNQEAYINIPSKADFEDVKNEITPLLTDVSAFETLAKKLGYKKRIKGGRYVIRKGMNSNEIVKTLLGNGINVKVIIPKNTTIETIAQQVSNQIEATQNELIEILQDSMYLNEKKLSFAKLYAPGSYAMPWNTSATEFRIRMYEIYQKP